MTSKSLLVLVAIASCVCSPLRTTDAASLKKSNETIGSIVEEIRKDEQICVTRSIFLNSRFVSSCNDLDYSKVPMTLDDKYSKQFLCLAFYDRVFRLCWLASVEPIGKSLLPENATTFDLKVEKLATVDPANFCKEWKNECPVQYSKIKPFLNEFNEDMKKWMVCLRFCTNVTGVFDPLCSVLAAMDALSMQSAEGRAACVHEKKEEKVSESNKEGSMVVVPPSTVLEETKKPDKQSVHETVAKRTETYSSGTEKNTAKKIEYPTSRVPSTKEERPTETRDTPSKLNEASKASDAAAVASFEKKEDKKKDESPTARATEDKKPKVPKDNEKPALADPDLINNAQIDTAERPVSEHETSDQETERVLDPPDVPNEEISEHTQEGHDEQTGGGVDTFDDFNELAPSTLPSEDVNESPPLPSDRQEFIPRLPGIRNDDDSHFFGYFSVIGIVCIAGYVGYHNKQKILAIVLEGRRSRGGRGRRRPSTANYRKLDCTLEEAVTSQCNSNVTHVIY